MPPHDVNPTQGFKATRDQLDQDWRAEEAYWRDNWQSRPYASADRGFQFYVTAYRYGFESGRDRRGSEWHEVERDLRDGWERYKDAGQTTWEQIKEAVRDGWQRATNR
jgi:hypothetical protein